MFNQLTREQKIAIGKSAQPANLVRTIIEIKKLMEIEGYSYEDACMIVLNLYM